MVVFMKMNRKCCKCCLWCWKMVEAATQNATSAAGRQEGCRDKVGEPGKLCWAAVAPLVSKIRVERWNELRNRVQSCDKPAGGNSLVDFQPDGEEHEASLPGVALGVGSGEEAGRTLRFSCSASGCHFKWTECRIFALSLRPGRRQRSSVLVTILLRIYSLWSILILFQEVYPHESRWLYPDFTFIFYFIAFPISCSVVNRIFDPKED